MDGCGTRLIAGSGCRASRHRVADEIGADLRGRADLAAAAKADKRGATVVIAVVDDGGQLILLERLNDTQMASVDVATAKARTAAIVRRPSKEFEDQVRNGRVAAVTLPGATPLQGGLPIVVEDQVVGAIGVSGNSPQQDEDIARAGLAALTATPDTSSTVRYFPASKVTEAFVEGEPLIEEANYKVYDSHRDESGMVEVHTRDMDVNYVVEGTATFRNVLGRLCGDASGWRASAGEGAERRLDRCGLECSYSPRHRSWRSV